MNRFGYVRALDVADAIRHRQSDAAAQFIAGGTNLIDLMKENVSRPTLLIDITHLDLHQISGLDGGGLRLGALASNTEVAYDDTVEQRYPLLSSAILAGASPQLRNAATVGGNLLQRTRCVYFYDRSTPCNKRETGSGCSAIGGITRMHAILGASEHCIAVHPSDMCVALAALDAVVNVSGPGGERTIPFDAFHRLPDDHPDRDTNLRDEEIITSVDLPQKGFAGNYSYLKLRDRLSYAFALVSVAAAIDVEGGSIRDIRIALGGVAHKPWRDKAVEASLMGRTASRGVFAEGADALLQGARGAGGNDFKIDLARRAIVRALEQAAASTPQSRIDKRVQ